MCPSCGNAVHVEDLFCEACGTRLQATNGLPSAGIPAGPLCACPPAEAQPDESGFCEHCGKPCTLPPPLLSSLPESTCADLPPMIEVVDEKLAVVSDRGRKHPLNEDRGSVLRLDAERLLLVVADGVSSSSQPATAAAIATQTVRDTLRDAFQNQADESDALAIMREAIQSAHEAILALPNSVTPDQEVAGDVSGDIAEDGPEATVVAVYKQGKRLVYGWVGDSRLYLLQEGRATLLTRDDSWLEEVVTAGQLSLSQAMSDRRAHCVTQVLGMKDAPLQVHVAESMVAETATLLLCSDGLWNYFPSPSSLATTVAQMPNADARTLCLELVATANRLGGHDNITVAVALP